ncbi:MAG: ATP-binding protein [Burkholderiaceae bacterium]
MKLRLGLRPALLLALIPVLLLPWLGMRFVGEMVDLTRDQRRESLAGAARSYAAALHERGDLFAQRSETALPGGARAIVANRLARVVVDGRLSEWAGLERFPIVASPLGAAPQNTLTLGLVVAQTSPVAGSDTFLLLEAADERYVRRQNAEVAAAETTVSNDTKKTPSQALAGDSVQVWAGERFDALLPVAAEPVETKTGWLVEAALPINTRFIRLQVEDVDYQARRVIEATADSGLLIIVGGGDEADSLKAVQAKHRAQIWEAAIAGIDRSGLRVAVYDAGGNLLAMRGDFSGPRKKPEGWLAQLARRFLSLAVSIGASSADETDAAAQPPLSQALTGFSADDSRRMNDVGDEPFWVTTSAHPIWLQDRVAGALLLEQGSSNDLATAQTALEWLALLAAAAIAATVLALLSLATLTVARIRRLKQAANAAIDARGRVVGRMPAFKLHDEISELAGSYDTVLARLGEHQHYLANLRSRLVHELRTPIMIVRSSLENLRDDPPADPTGSADVAADANSASPGTAAHRAYVERALGGAMRLERMVSSMSEASSVESMLSSSQLERTNLADLLDGLAQAYNQAYHARHAPGKNDTDASRVMPRFIVEKSVTSAQAMVVPEAIAQAVDKLASNAVDFAEATAPIGLELETAPGGFSISVRNRGPSLPDVMSDSLFESMVSVRTDTAREQSHLGLGLYLVRLIAEFHGGTPFATNTVDGVRIGFTIRASIQ